MSPSGSTCLFFDLLTHCFYDAPQSVESLWVSDQPVAQTSTWQHTTLTTDKHPCPRVGFEPTISAGERPKTYALDRAATAIGSISTISSTVTCLYKFLVSWYKPSLWDQYGCWCSIRLLYSNCNPLNTELNPIFHLLALLGGATTVVVSRLRVNNI